MKVSKWNSGYVVAYCFCILFCLIMVAGFVGVFFLQGDTGIKVYLAILLAAAAVAYGFLAHSCKNKAKEMH